MYKGLTQFREAVTVDSALLAELRSLENVDRFAARLVELGSKRGYRFDEGDVKEALRRSQREWFGRKAR